MYLGQAVEKSSYDMHLYEKCKYISNEKEHCSQDIPVFPFKYDKLAAYIDAGYIKTLVLK
jgi:hypothetical protein